MPRRPLRSYRGEDNQEELTKGYMYDYIVFDRQTADVSFISVA